jgi:tetracycline 7-halogenase / FADH2 O2-dependent halogenase
MSERISCDVAIVGSGFAGSIAARVLLAQGYRVALLERGTHPRFAIGESSTPLAAIALESLAARYGLADLRALAAYGRWMERFPEVRRGLKRGFSFFGHRPGRAFHEAPTERLLVAASPHDGVSDTHWLRADVDHLLLRRALEDGALYRDQTRLDGVEFPAAGVRLTGERRGERIEVEAGFLIDASGFGGFLATALPIAPAPERITTNSALVFSHFAGALDFAAVAEGEGVALPHGPYPDDKAALHHLYDLGWMYILSFDHGVVSAGFLLDGHRPEARAMYAEGASDPAALWSRLLERYPSIGRQFVPAEPLFPVRAVPRLQHRLSRAAGDRWLLLPSAFAFTDPLFSTGIAWSLAGVERVGRMFADGLPAADDLARYEALLADEADAVDRMVAGAYKATPDFDLFAAYSLLYFAFVSFVEASRRLKPEAKDWAWEGFFGCRDPLVSGAFAEAHRRLDVLTAEPSAERATAIESFTSWVAEAIEPRNVAGLADPARGNLYPVDLEALVESAGKLGMTREEAREALPRLLR